MATVFDTRRANLRTLMRQWGGPTSLATKLGHANGSYLAQIAGPNPRKDVSEKQARAIEAKLDLPAGWMDKRHSSSPGEPDTALLVDIVALVHDSCATAHVTLPRAKFTEVVQLVYERSAEGGAVDMAYLRRLINLTK